MRNEIIPYGRHSISQKDIDAVIDVLKSDYLTQGSRINEFEEAFAKYVGSKYAIAVANGTAALHLCTLAVGVNEGDKVITTPITFAASANCVRYCGGEVVFADIDPATYLLDINKVKDLLEGSPKGTFKGIIPVDFAGRSIDLEAFRKLADEYDLWIIEDACHAPGAYFKDSTNTIQKCGNSNYADLAIFSFHPVKHIACGEGGMITTNNILLYNKLLALRSHGITKNENEYSNSVEFACGQETIIGKFPGWYMEMHTLGYNYRLTDFQAALGTSQLKRAESGLVIRRKIARMYYDAFVDAPFVKGQTGVVEGHAFHLYIIEVKNRLGLYNFLKEHRIHAQIHYIPVHLMPYYKNLGWNEGDFTNAEEYYKHCISLPMYPGLKIETVRFVIDKIFEFYDK